MSRRTARTVRTAARRLTLGAAFVVVAATGLATALAYQEGSPAPPDVPRPEECRVELRPLPLFPAAATGAAATPAPLATATPVALPSGEPADEATVAAVSATVREAIACRNAGDFGRAYALVSDRFLGQLFGGPDTVAPEVAAALEEGPDRVPRANRLALVAVTEVVALGDGRAGAVVETRNAAGGFRDYLRFVRVADRWLIDEQIALLEPGPATASP